MLTVVFVHGTGVRKKSFDLTFSLIKEALHKVAPDISTVGCYWGGLGANLGRDGASIPDATAPRAVPEASPDMWPLLDLDALCEVEGLFAAQDPELLAPNVLLWDGEAALMAAIDNSHVRSELMADRLDVFAEAAVRELVIDARAQTLGQLSAAGYQETVARALVAAILARADAEYDGAFPVDGRAILRLVDSIAAALGRTSARGEAEHTPFGLRLANALGVMRRVERKRAATTRAATPLAGDVLHYLARGERIRDFVTRSVSEVDGDVILMGHSLGGIISFDVLASSPPPNVVGFVTVGTQVGLLYEINALPSIALGRSLPKTFPSRWCNVYDERDLLAFLAAPVFPEHAVDVRTDGGVPFPRAHSAYFAGTDVYKAVLSVAGRSA